VQLFWKTTAEEFNAGWGAILERTKPKTLDVWKSFWGEDEDEAVTIAGVFRFLSVKRRVREIPPVDRVAFDQVWCDMIRFVAHYAEVFVFEVYAKERDIDATLPTVLRSGSRVKGGCVDPGSAWAILERSHGLFNATPETVAAVKSDEQAYRGLTSRTGTKCSGMNETRSIGCAIEVSLACVATHQSIRGHACGMIAHWHIFQACLFVANAKVGDEGVPIVYGPSDRDTCWC